MEITLNINRKNVYKEVAKSTNYTGAKMEGANEALYDRISTTDEDEEILERFWNESRADVAQTLMRVLRAESMKGDDYSLVLDVSAAFDKALQPSMELSLVSYFVQSIVAKWFVLANKQEAGEYADKARAFLEDVREKAFYKRKPTRPVYV